MVRTRFSWQLAVGSRQCAINNRRYIKTACTLLTAYCLLLLSTSVSAQRPDFKDSKEGDTVVVNRKVYIIHKCAKDETVFTIANKFHVSVNDLDNANKDVINNLKKNTVLLIPVPKKKEVVKKEELKPIYKDLTYNIALLIPFNEAINYAADSTLVTGYVLNPSLERETTSSLEFYEGVLTAIDSLKKKGLKAHITVVDAFDSTTVINAKTKAEVKGADMIMTNLGQNLVSLLNHYPVNGKPVIVSCGTNTAASLKGDSSAFFTAPSSLSQCQQMGEYYKNEKTEKNRFIIINTTLSKEKERTNAFSNVLSDANDAALDKVTLDSTTQPLKPLVTKLLTKGKSNIVFLPTTDEAFVSNVISYLKTVNAEYEVTLVGLPTWQYFQSVSPEDLQVLHTTIFSAVNISYQSAPVVVFRKKFSDIYATEPSENAFVGYDAMMFFGEQLLSHGITFSEHAIPKHYTGLSTEFDFVKEQGGNGFGNDYISVLRFEDYSLKKVNK